MSARSFDLDDFRKQIDHIKQLGSDGDTDGEVLRIQGMIDSMTPHERRNPSSINPSRSRRIAVGAGVPPSEVAGFLGHFHGMAALVRQMARRSRNE